MSANAAPKVDCEQQHPGFAVPDVLRAADFYTTKLGFTPGFTWGNPPTFAAVNLGEMQLFLEQGAPGPGSSVYFVIGNADELYEFHRTSGVEIVEPIGNRDYELRDYSIKDLHGYRLTFGHRIPETGPALEIERVAVPVRIEKRLAAVLADLAEFKHMSVSSCLEETLLHTFERLGEGVASPHTKADLRHIQELKKKHGIDYDTHASYRFVER